MEGFTGVIPINVTLGRELRYTRRASDCPSILIDFNILWLNGVMLVPLTVKARF